MKRCTKTEFVRVIYEHHIHKNEWCPIKSCQDYVKEFGRLPFIIATFPVIDDRPPKRKEKHGA